MTFISGNDLSFNGKLYVVNKLSKKPAQCIEKEKSNLLKLIKKEKFDLFIKQDYIKNKVNIVATTKDQPHISSSNMVNVTAKGAQYLAAAKRSVENYGKIRDDYFYKAYKNGRTFKQKFYDFINDVLYDLVWGK